VVAAAIVEAFGDDRPTAAGIDATLFAAAALLLVAGIITLAVEAHRLRSKPRIVATTAVGSR
jgi:hypothetical protein